MASDGCAAAGDTRRHDEAVTEHVGRRVGVSSQAASRVARDRLGARSRARAASGLTGSMRVSE